MRKKPKGDTWDGIFADPEVGRVLKLKGLIADANKSSIEELATITSLNPGGKYNTSYFHNNKTIRRFPELKYCTGLTSLIYAFRDCSNLIMVGDIIPEGVTTLGSAFYGCSSLTEAPIVPSSVTNLNYTFTGCSSIDGIYIINIVTPPSYSSSLSNVKAIYVPDESVDTYKSSDGWSDFADKIYPMSDKGWDDIFFADPEVGRVLKSNGLIADANKSSKRELATITSLNPSDTSSGSYFYNNTRIKQFPELQYCTGLTSLRSAFEKCTNLTTVVIPESVTDMRSTFDSCKFTSAPVIPESVTNMMSTFSFCSNLTTAPVIPSSVTSLFCTFQDCTSLTTAPIIPSSVTSLGFTFYHCSSIDGIYIINIVTPPTYSDSLSNVQAIYVPDASVSAYKSKTGWSDHRSKIYPISSKP